MNNIIKKGILLLLTVAFYISNASAQRRWNNWERHEAREERHEYAYKTHFYRNNYYPRYYSNNFFYPHYNYRPFYRSPFDYVHFGPAFGIRLNILPVGYNRIYVGPNPYYYYDGIYYRPYNNGGYEVVAPPLGAVVNRLPKAYNIKVINGEKYYEVGGTFYQQQIMQNGAVKYAVVGTDGVINTNADAQTQPIEYNNQNTNPIPNPSTNNDNPPVRNSQYAQLPPNCKVVYLQNKKYYLTPSGNYYEEIIDGNNNISYSKINPQDLPK